MTTHIAVIDTETTGLEETDRVVEVAMVVLRRDEPHAIPGLPRLADLKFASLVNPGGVAVSVQARAAHHITDEELVGAPILDQIGWLEKIAHAHILAGHNVAFDRRILVQSGFPEECLPKRTICTHRCALHIYPDAPAYSNQVLRYYLGLRVVVPRPHRALDDAVVTAAILDRMLEEKTVDELVDLSTRPVLLKTVRFGKHYGKAWRDLPVDYLRWIVKQDFDCDELYTAKHWLAEKETLVAAAVVALGVNSGRTESGDVM